MQTALRVWIAIGACEVNRDRETDLASTENVLKERVSLLELQLGKAQLVVAERTLILVCDRVLNRAFLQLSKGHLTHPDVTVAT